MIDADHVAALALAVIIPILLVWGITVELGRHRRRNRQAAQRRHLSARTTMTDAERKYHGSDQWGR